MRKAVTILSLLLTIFPTAAQVCRAQGKAGDLNTPEKSGLINLKKPTAQKGRRVCLKFPEQLIGSIAVAQTDELNTSQLLKGESVGPPIKACGTINFTVPAGMLVLLALSGDAVTNPKLLNQIPQEGIDIVKFNYLSMDDKTDHACDQVLKSLSRLKHLRHIIAESTDITDRGVDQLESLKELQGLQITATPLKGSCFKTLSHLPRFNKIIATAANFDQNNFQYLGAMPRLRVLGLRSSNTSTQGLELLSRSKTLCLIDLTDCKRLDLRASEVLVKLKALQYLSLGETKSTNKSVESLSRMSNLVDLDLRNLPLTDACIPDLRKMTKLQKLNISNTQITLKGVESLRGLHLKRLCVPYRAELFADQAKLLYWFPNCQFDHNGDSVQLQNRKDFNLITNQRDRRSSFSESP